MLLKRPRTAVHVVLTVILMIAGVGAHRALAGEDDSYTAKQVVFLPRDYLTLIAPFDGKLAKIPKVGDVVLPSPHWPDSWFAHPSFLPDVKLTAFLKDVEQYAIAHIKEVNEINRTQTMEEISRSTASALAQFGVRSRRGNQPPWMTYSILEPEKANLLKAAQAAVSTSMLPYEQVQLDLLEEVRAAIRGSQPTERVRDWIDSTKERLEEPYSNHDILWALECIVVWRLRNPEIWLYEYGTALTPFDGGTWEPNHPDLYKVNADPKVTGKITFLVRRSDSLEKPVDLDGLRRFGNYWDWVIANDIFDTNDNQLLDQIIRDHLRAASLNGQPTPSLSRRDVAVGLRDEARSAYEVLLASYISGWALHKAFSSEPPMPINADPTNNENALIKAAKSILPGDLPSGVDPEATIRRANEASGNEVGLKWSTGFVSWLNGTAQAMAFVAVKRAEPPMSFQTAVWLVNQLRPSIRFRGNYLDVLEERGRVTAKITESFDEARNARMGLSLWLHTQGLPLNQSNPSSLSRNLASGYLANMRQEDAYTRLLQIEMRSALSLSPSVATAIESQQADEFRAISILFDFYRAELDADLWREGDQILSEYDAFSASFDDEQARRRFGFIFAAEKARVESVVTQVGSLVRKGDPLAVVRPLFRYDVTFDFPTDDPVAKEFFIPGAKLAVAAECTKPLGIPIATKEKILASGNREPIISLLKLISRRYFEKARFEAQVLTVSPVLNDEAKRMTTRIAVDVPEVARTIDVHQMANANQIAALRKVGFRIDDGGAEQKMELEEPPFEIGGRCNLKFFDFDKARAIRIKKKWEDAVR